MRILFHFTHKQTLGHTTRSVALTAALSRLGAEVLVLQGGLPQSFVRFSSQCRVVDIPVPFDTKASFDSHVVPTSSAERAKFILKAAAEFNPDVFITEFFPFGRLAYMPELLPTLRYLRKKGVRIIASVGYPLLIDLDRRKDPTFAALHRAVFAFYDKFLIHTPKNLETEYVQKMIQSPTLAKSYQTFMTELKPRLAYTGYVFPEPMLHNGTSLPVEQSKNRKNILVSRGGGAVYPNLISTAIDALAHLDPNIRMIIACGPATCPKEIAAFQSRVRPADRSRVVLTERLDNLNEHLCCCDVSVSLCGYNTSVQLMRYGTPSVIIPYQNKKSHMPTNDQMARSQLLADQFSSVILDYETMSAQSLAKAIKEQLSKPRPKSAPEKWFNGAETAARLVVADKAN